MKEFLFDFTTYGCFFLLGVCSIVALGVSIERLIRLRRLQLIDPKVGGKFHMSFTNFGTGQSHGFGGTFLELTLPTRLRYTDQFDDPGLPGTMTVTVARPAYRDLAASSRVISWASI